MLYITSGTSWNAHSAPASAAALSIALSLRSRTILTMNSTHMPAAASAQISVESTWDNAMHAALTPSSGQLRFSPSTTSYSPSRNSGRKTIAVISPNA